VNDVHFTKTYGVSDEDLDAYIASRIALVRAGDPTPMDIHTSDGRVIVTDLVRQANQLQQLAITDGLTQLFNRRHFLAVAEAEWVRLQRYYRPFCVLAFDVDYFKTVNDRFGHAAGDAALVHLAARLKECMRAVDMIGRTGGDEFLVMLPETRLQEAQIVADRFIEIVRSRPFEWKNTSVLLSISVGVAEASLSMNGVEPLPRQADKALYMAKANGRNRSDIVVVGEKALKQAAQ
jgi:diguanylate cyclase (GGDEF)-like protein